MSQGGPRGALYLHVLNETRGVDRALLENVTRCDDLLPWAYSTINHAAPDCAAG